MIKYLSLFSGIGAFEKALQRLEIPYELVGYCEIDKYASKAYSLLHSVPESMNFGDITQLDETQLPDDIDLITYGFPCLNTTGGGNREPMILVRANTKKGYEVAELGDSINLEYPNSTTRRGRVGKQIAQTITTSPQQGG